MSSKARASILRPRRQRTVLTVRDTELLLSLYKYRLLSVAQVERLFFPSTQTARRRIRILAADGYVSTFRAPGVPDRIAHLAPRGLAVVAVSMGASAADLGSARTQPKDHYFLRHALAATDFRIAVALACSRHPDVSLRGFLDDRVVEKTERGLLRRYLRDVTADIRAPEVKVGHTPDGVFALAHCDSTALFFVEVDRGTESVANHEHGFAKTLRFYLNYLVGGGYTRYEQEFGVMSPFSTVRVLVLTSSRRRLENIRSVGAGLRFEPARALSFIWLAELGAVTTETVFSTPWVSLDPGYTNTYRILSDRHSPTLAGEALARD